MSEQIVDFKVSTSMMVDGKPVSLEVKASGDLQETRRLCNSIIDTVREEHADE